MSRKPEFIQVPTLQQLCAVFLLVRKGREIVAKGELLPEDALDLRSIMSFAEREFDLSFINERKEFDEEHKADLVILKDHLRKEGINQ